MFRPPKPQTPSATKYSKMQRPSVNTLVGLISLILSITALNLPLSSSAATENAQKNTSFPGGVYQWTPPADAEHIKFRNKPVMQIGNTVLVGLPVSQPLGKLSVSYSVNNQQQIHSFEVVEKQYTEQHITLKNKEMVNPKPKQLERIRRESKVQKALYQQVLPAQDLRRGFVLPLQGITTSLFGHRRFFNGEPRNPHSGLDIAADTGTPIIAPADAKVVLVDDLYFNGKTVFLDHGQGLITMYCHMSEHKVAAADTVKQGETIGLVGATGRVTGPHLHWSVSLNGVRVDPLEFQQALASALSSENQLYGNKRGG